MIDQCLKEMFIGNTIGCRIMKILVMGSFYIGLKHGFGHDQIYILCPYGNPSKVLDNSN
jgi:hypothetical protein